MTSLKMTSEEALEALFDLLCEREHTNSEHTFWLKLYQEVKKDLKVLEILKYRIHLKDSVIKNDMKEYEVCFIEASGFVFKSSKEYKLLKGWLNDK